MAPKKNKTQQQPSPNTKDIKHQEQEQFWDINDYAIKGKEWAHKHPARQQHDVICEVCTTTKSLKHNELVQCSGCQDHWHQQCHDPVIYNIFTEPPEVEGEKKRWWCKRCDHVCGTCQEKGSNHSYRKGKKSEEYDALVGCGGCGKFWHQNCVTPRIDGQFIDPRQEWNCPPCAVKAKKAKIEKAEAKAAAKKAAGESLAKDTEGKKLQNDRGAQSTSGENTSTGAEEAEDQPGNEDDGPSDAEEEGPPPKPPVARRRSARQSQVKAGKTSAKVLPSGEKDGQATTGPPQARQKGTRAKSAPISKVQAERETDPLAGGGPLVRVEKRSKGEGVFVGI
ncbi:hypothetical protein H2201_007390 [Coniosporium apollinis]|uniref:PHD-type domain-containing protein n=1 Tax=Coniosporium apollinis TaxID=61459 RepID=A0ABQ9NJI3_9PEZI|nr:hypothetical protein H2201_007390 [Coniosporium apollinis]